LFFSVRVKSCGIQLCPFQILCLADKAMHLDVWRVAALCQHILEFANPAAGATHAGTTLFEAVFKLKSVLEQLESQNVKHGPPATFAVSCGVAGTALDFTIVLTNATRPIVGLTSIHFVATNVVENVAKKGALRFAALCAFLVALCATLLLWAPQGAHGTPFAAHTAHYSSLKQSANRATIG